MSDEDIKLSRRKILAGLGTIGVASAGAGLGTTAWLSDEESFLNNVLTAGTLDLIVDYNYFTYQGAATDFEDDVGSGTNNGGEGEAAGGDPINFQIGDVKPGDWGHLQFCFDIVDNPAYLWACGTLTESVESTGDVPAYTEPEPEDGPEGELDDAIKAVAYYCPDFSEPDFEATADGPPAAVQTQGASVNSPLVIAHGSLGDVVQGLTYGVPLDGEVTEPGRQPFRSKSQEDDDGGFGNPCVCIAWWIPEEVGNEIQGDSISFDLTFNAVQSRHNDGTANPCCDCTDDEVALCVDGEVHCVTPFTGESVEDWYDFSPFESHNDAIQEPSTATVTLFRESGSDDLYLVTVNDDRTSTGGGAADYTITGLSGGQSWVVQDDDASATDDYTAGGSTATGLWEWGDNRTDGGVLGALGDTFDVTVDMAFNDAATKGPRDPGTVDSVRVIEDDGSGGASPVWSTDFGDSVSDAEASVRLRSQCVTVEQSPTDMPH